MQIYYFSCEAQTRIYQVSQQPCALSEHHFVWLECNLAEVYQGAQWQAEVLKHTGIQLNEYHLADLKNLTHPSIFDSTENYNFLIF